MKVRRIGMAGKRVLHRVRHRHPYPSSPSSYSWKGISDGCWIAHKIREFLSNSNPAILSTRSILSPYRFSPDRYAQQHYDFHDEGKVLGTRVPVFFFHSLHHTRVLLS